MQAEEATITFLTPKCLSRPGVTKAEKIDAKEVAHKIYNPSLFKPSCIHNCELNDNRTVNGIKFANCTAKTVTTLHRFFGIPCLLTNIILV